MNDKTLETSKLYIDLDALLDTRMALVFGQGETIAKAAIDSGYYERFLDDFPGLPFEKFRSLYEKRDKKVLKNAMITKVTWLMREFVMSTLSQVFATPFHQKPVIVVNIHPYELSEEEQSNILQAVVSLTNEKADVSIVSMSPDEVTPQYVKRELSMMVKYEYLQWIELHCQNDNFRKVTCPDVVMIGPAVFFRRPDKKALEDAKQRNISPFNAVEEMVAPFIGVKLIPVEHFSLDIKLVPSTQKAP